jgi:hypothetical protein
MRWKIQIEGDKKYLEDLCNVFNTLNFDPKIYKDGKNYYLEGSIFEKSSDVKEISEKAKTFITLLTYVPNFKSRVISEAVIVKNIIETIEVTEGYKIITYSPDGEISSEDLITKDGKKYINLYDHINGKTSIQANLTVLGRQNDFTKLKTIEEILILMEQYKDNEEYLKKLSKYLSSLLNKILKFSVFSNEPELEKTNVEIVSLLSDLELINKDTNIETLKWVILYKIFEAIGGKSKWSNLVGKDTLDKFSCTAQLKRHSQRDKANKECEEKIKKLGEMPLSEAEDLISTLLLKYIEEKTKGEKDG